MSNNNNQIFPTNVRVNGSTILHRYIEIKDGLPNYKLSKETNFEPTIFTTAREKTGWTNLYGVDVKPNRMDSISAAKEWMKTYDGVDGIEIHGGDNYSAEYMARQYPGVINYTFSALRLFFIDIEVSTDPKYSGFPSPMLAERPITAITIYDSTTKIFHCFGEHEAKIDREDVVFYDCGSEKKLITSFVSFWKSNHPDIVTGWNINGFDTPYLINRIVNVFDEDYAKNLSPWGKIDSKDKKDAFGNSEIMVYDIWGVECLDYIDLYKKYYPKKQETYNLDFIANKELGVGKLEYDGSLWDLYCSDYSKYCLYNIIDSERVVQIDKKLQMIALQVNLSYRAKINYKAASGPVNLWTNIIYHSLYEENKVYAPRRHQVKESNIEGAHVIAPKVGLHEWVVTIDATSLYPSMIMSFNISPETMIQNIHELPVVFHEYYNRNLVQEIINNELPQELFDYLKEYDLTMTAKGQFFRRDVQGVLPRIVDSVFKERKTAKNKMLELKAIKEAGTITDEAELAAMTIQIGSLSVEEQGKKVALNALYGATANEYFQMYDVRMAESITLSGQAGLLTVGKAMSKWLGSIDGRDASAALLAGDTDSCFLSLSGVANLIESKKGKQTTDEMVDLICKFADNQLAATSKKICLEISTNLNMFQNRLDFKREKIIPKMAYVAKKRYIAMVADAEGIRYKTPELSCTGVETNKSSTPKLIRGSLSEAFKLLLTSDIDTVRSFVKKSRDIFFNAKIEEISFPRGVNGVAKYNAKLNDKGKRIPDAVDIYKKGTPKQVRAALMYNHLVETKGLSNKYPMIKDAESIKFIQLYPQNPTREDVIGFKDVWPVEFELDKYIDKETQFQLAFLDPLTSVLDKIEWSLEDKVGVDQFF